MPSSKSVHTVLHTALRACAAATVLFCFSACDSTRKLLAQAEQYMVDERYPAAVRTYDQVLKESPGEPRALVGLARAWLETKQPEKAITPAQVAAETEVAGGRQVLVDALLANGRGLDALDLAAELADSSTNPIAWRRLTEVRLAAGDLKGAVASAEKSLELGGGSQAQSLAAWTHARNGNCSRATGLAGRAATGAASDITVQAEAAAVFRQCMETAQAQGASSTARTLLNRGPFNEEEEATRRQRGGDLEGAIRRLSWLRSIYPEEGLYARHLGILWADAKVWGRAEAELVAALRLPPFAIATTAAGVQFADRRSEQLTPDQRQAAVAQIWTELSRVRSNAGDIGGMAEALEERARSLRSTSAEDWLKAAQAWAVSSTPARGVESAMRAVDLAPDSYDARKVATLVLANAGIKDRAIGHGRNAWAIRPGDPDLALLLGRLHISRGEMRDARSILTEGFNANPHDPRLHDALRRLEQIR
jgi:tetratricopeptide (TPR) repeat protein